MGFSDSAVLHRILQQTAIFRTQGLHHRLVIALRVDLLHFLDLLVIPLVSTRHWSNRRLHYTHFLEPFFWGLCHLVELFIHRFQSAHPLWIPLLEGVLDP